MPYIDPSETDPSAWGGDEGDERPLRTVYERAHATPVPYERDDLLVRHGDALTEAFRTREYEHARVAYHLAVEADGRVKLLTKGHLWGGGERHQRFRAQYRRESEPSDTDPFTAYTAWIRFQFGTVGRSDGGLTFQPDADATEVSRTLDWDDLFRSDQLRLAELELVRNPPLARYVLRDRGRWDAVRDSLRYSPEAFVVGP